MDEGQQKILDPLIKAKGPINNTINKDDEDISAVDIETNDKQKLVKEGGNKRNQDAYHVKEHLMSFEELAKTFETDVNI